MLKLGGGAVGGGEDEDDDDGRSGVLDNAVPAGSVRLSASTGKSDFSGF